MLKSEDFYLSVGELREAAQIAIDSNGLHGLDQLQTLVDNLRDYYSAGKVEQPQYLLRRSRVPLKMYWLKGGVGIPCTWRPAGS